MNGLYLDLDLLKATRCVEVERKLNGVGLVFSFVKKVKTISQLPFCKLNAFIMPRQDPKFLSFDHSIEVRIGITKYQAGLSRLIFFGHLFDLSFIFLPVLSSPSC